MHLTIVYKKIKKNDIKNKNAKQMLGVSYV